MEIQLKELIDTIKEEGFKSAQLDGQEIVEKAKEEAALIVSNAKQEASLLFKRRKLKSLRINLHLMPQFYKPLGM